MFRSKTVILKIEFVHKANELLLIKKMLTFFCQIICNIKNPQEKDLINAILSRNKPALPKSKKIPSEKKDKENEPLEELVKPKVSLG